MKFALVSALCLGIAASNKHADEQFVEGGTLNLKWTDCGDSSYHAKVTGLSPTTLLLGSKTTVTGSGNVDQQVTGGGFTITAKFGVIEHYSGDVCSSKVIKLPLGVGTITWEGLKCPVAKGAVGVKVDVQLSKLIPAKLAKGTIEIKAAGASKENLICLDIDTSAARQELPQLTNAEAAPQQCLPAGAKCKPEPDACHANCCTGTWCLSYPGGPTPTCSSMQELPQLTTAPVVQPNFGLAPFQEPMVELGQCLPGGAKCKPQPDACHANCCPGTACLAASLESNGWPTTCVTLLELPQLTIAPVVQPNFGLAPFQEPMVEGGNLNLKWTDCGDSSYHAKVTGLSPTTLPIGSKTTITGSGNVDEQVTGGGFTITAKFGVTEHYSGDVCSSKVIKLPLGVGTITWEGLKCPVAKGAVGVKVDVQLSKLIPAKLAKGTIEIKAAGASKENLICLDIDTSAARQELPEQRLLV